MQTKSLVDELREKLEGYYNDPNMEDPKPPFDFKIGWCADYDRLFTGESDSETSIESLENLDKVGNRLILSARGGAAKTTILRRLARTLLKRGAIPIMLDLKRWRPTHEVARRSLQSYAELLEFLFEHVGPSGFGSGLLDAIPSKKRKVLLVDGLNEIASPLGQDVIRALDEAVSFTPTTDVIVADRLVRRTFVDPSRWQIATLLPLSREAIRSALIEVFNNAKRYDGTGHDNQVLLTSPYFLNQVLKDEPSDFATYFAKHVGLSEDEVSTLAAAAFQAYQRDASRLFSLAYFKRVVGPAILDRLVTSRDIVVVEDQAYFEHHLKHDYLAAVHLAADQDLWTSDSFDLVSFHASSFDALSMALEQITDTDDADLFVRRLYDWNLYGSAYALTESATGVPRNHPASEEMETAILAMLAIRRWDPMMSTRTKAADALRLFPKETSGPYLSANSVDAVKSIVAATSGEKPWYNQWKRLFANMGAVRLSTPNSLELLKDPESLIGWTWSNVLKSSGLGSSEQMELRTTLVDRSADATTRWRVAHVLGSFPTRENAEALLESIDTSEHRWVRYGATRSLIEMAAETNDDDLRNAIMSSLEDKLDVFEADARSEQELRSALLIAPDVATPEWPKAALGLVRAFFDAQETEEARDDWHRLAYEIRALYGNAGVPREEDLTA
jgi:hypothetical protein